MSTIIDNLKKRWQVKSGLQVLLILVVFACTGYSTVIIKHLLHISRESPLWLRISFYVGIFPVYNILLLAYGYIFGQYSFFLNFEKRMFKRIKDFFVKPK